MSSFFRGLGLTLLETAGETDVTHTGHVANSSHGQTPETVPCRRPLFPRPGCRSVPNEDSLPENPANALASPENLIDAVKSPIPNERSSPEPNCSICLGKLQNKSFTNGCLHMFCYKCLLQWSKIKAECPLCKQSFKSIIHTVRSMQDYEEYELPTTPPIRVRELDPAGNFSAHYRRGFPENVAFMHAMHDLQAETFGIPMPFRYRTTMTSRRQSFTEYISHSWVLPPAPPTHNWRRRRQVATPAFRESIYVQDLWAVPPDEIGARYRDCTPAFYRANPAQVHRLVPWLNRELAVLFHTATGNYPASLILDLILRYITRFEIRSTEFARLVRPHIGFRTEHFLHEFYSFASSHYDLIGYDQNVTYRANPNPATSIHISDDSDSDIEIISTSMEGGLNSNVHIPFMARSTSSLSEPSGYGVTSVAGPSTEPMAGPSRARDESNDCEVVGYVKPLHERTPEVIELSSEDESPERPFGVDNLLGRMATMRSAADTDNLSSSSSSRQSSGSEYLPERKRTAKKAAMKRWWRRGSSAPYPRNDRHEEDTDSRADLPTLRRRRSSSSSNAMPSTRHRDLDNIPSESRLEQSRNRAIYSYMRHNLLSDSGSTTSSRSTLRPRENRRSSSNQPPDLLNQSSSSVECLGAMTGNEFPSSPSSFTSNAGDGETISTRAHHGSIASESMPQHSVEDWDFDSVSESDISLAVLKARASPEWAQPSTSWATSSGRGTTVHRPVVKTENEPSSSVSVISSIGNVGPSRSKSHSNRKRPAKRLRSAVFTGPSTSGTNSPGNPGDSWQRERRVPVIDSDSSDDSSGETKPRLKSVVITRNFKPVVKNEQSAPEHSDEASSRLKRKHRWLGARRNSCPIKLRRLSGILSSTSDSSS